MDLGTPRIMAILNATPDSFYQGSRVNDPASALERAGEMIRSGADIIDIGAASTRPGAEPISEEMEKERLKEILGAFRERWPEMPLSLDTWRAGVATWAREQFEIDMINDISAGSLDPGMFGTAAKLNIPYVLMHMQGSPENMQDEPSYEQVTDEVLRFLGEKVEKLRDAGMTDLVIDPGFGFGKTLEQNFSLLGQLEAFRIMELPILVGLSRKSMIYKALDSTAEQALNGTTALHMAALLKGASILRVHDVAEARECIRLFQQF